MLIHSVYKNLLLINEESNLSSSDINNLLSNTWLTPLIELYQYDCLISFKTRSYTRMRFIRYLNELCENLKNTEKKDFLFIISSTVMPGSHNQIIQTIENAQKDVLNA